ncbi:unnamed protein product, partial [Linum tenue]
MDSENWVSVAVGSRVGEVRKLTKETNVSVKINLDGTGVADSSTGIPFLDHMLDQLASHGLFDVHVRATGDIHIDDHHTNEDVALATGSLQEEAVITLQCLGKFGDGAFEDIFTTNVDFSSKYDHYIRLNLKGSKEVYSSGFCLDDECWRLYEKQVHDLLSQGLGDRTKSVRVIWRNSSSGWISLISLCFMVA